MIQTFLPDRAEKSLHDGIHQRRPYRCPNDPCAGPLRDLVERGSVLVGPVANDELRPLAEGRRVSQLGPMFV